MHRKYSRFSVLVVVAFIFAFSGVAQADLNNGLVAYYPFNGDANDASGNGYDGVEFGSIDYDSGQNDLAALFQSPEDYIRAEAPINKDTSVTVSAWVKPTAVSNDGAMTIVFERSAAGNDYCGGYSFGNYALQIYQGKFSFDASTINDGLCEPHRIQDLDPIDPNKFYHIVGIFDKESKKIKIYRNGVLKNIEDCGDSLRTVSDASLTISRNGNNSSQHWNGLIDEIRIYDRALSESEIQELYNDSDGDGDNANAENIIIVPDDYQTINEAVENSSSGDTIKIKAGDYIIDEQIILQHPLIFEGEGADKTKVNAGSSIVGQYLIVAEWIPGGTSISGIHFINGGIHARECQKIDIYKNLIENPSGIGILLNDKWSCGISTAHLINNTIINCETGIATNDWRNLYMYNNLIAECKTGFLQYDVCHLYAEYNNFFNCDILWTGGSLPSNNLNNDPLLKIYEDTYGFLSDGSSCIDAGNPAEEYNDPDGSRNDIGAFPYVEVNFNTPPVADAGSDITGYINENTCVVGSGDDAENNQLTYIWSCETANVIVTEIPGTVYINTEAPGEYILELVVFDETDYSEPDYVTVTITTHEDEAVSSLNTASTEIGHLPTSSFKNKNNDKTLQNKIDAAIDLIDSGNIEEAYDKLTNDILKKTDGCSVSGTPDKNDWINNCADQNTVHNNIRQAIDEITQIAIYSSHTGYSVVSDSWPERNGQCKEIRPGSNDQELCGKYSQGFCYGVVHLELRWFYDHMNGMRANPLVVAYNNNELYSALPAEYEEELIDFWDSVQWGLINWLLANEVIANTGIEIIDSGIPAIVNFGYWRSDVNKYKFHSVIAYSYKRYADRIEFEIADPNTPNRSSVLTYDRVEKTFSFLETTYNSGLLISFQNFPLSTPIIP